MLAAVWLRSRFFGKMVSFMCRIIFIGTCLCFLLTACHESTTNDGEVCEAEACSAGFIYDCYQHLCVPNRFVEGGLEAADVGDGDGAIEPAAEVTDEYLSGLRLTAMTFDPAALPLVESHLNGYQAFPQLLREARLQDPAPLAIARGIDAAPELSFSGGSEFRAEDLAGLAGSNLSATDYFVVRWTGYLDAPAGEIGLRFGGCAPDDVALVFIDDDAGHGFDEGNAFIYGFTSGINPFTGGTQSRTRIFTADRKVPFEVIFLEEEGDVCLNLEIRPGAAADWEPVQPHLFSYRDTDTGF